MSQVRIREALAREILIEASGNGRNHQLLHVIVLSPEGLQDPENWNHVILAMDPDDPKGWKKLADKLKRRKAGTVKLSCIGAEKLEIDYTDKKIRLYTKGTMVGGYYQGGPIYTSFLGVTFVDDAEFHKFVENLSDVMLELHEGLDL